MTINSRVDQCKAVWYQWAANVTDNTNVFDVPLVSSSDGLAEATGFDISDHIMDFSYTKSISNGAGSFTLRLSNALDWPKIMKPGEWLAIYLSKDGDLPPPGSFTIEQAGPMPDSMLKKARETKALLNKFSGSLSPNLNTPDLPKPGPLLKDLKSKLRGLFLIQRVSIRSSVTAEGALDVSYIVSGKDFGVFLEETELWFNAYFFEQSVWEKVVSQNIGTGMRQLSQLMNTWFDVFFRPAAVFQELNSAKANSIVEHFKQWLIPTSMINDLGLEVDGDPYFGNLKKFKEFHETIFQNNLADPIAGMQGTAWEKLKEMSQPEFHEMFTEIEDDGTPRVIFRPIPWAINKERYPNIGQYMMRYIELAGEATGISDPQALLNNVNSAVKAAQAFFKDPLKSIQNSYDTGFFRKKHHVGISANDVISFEIGPDFHSRYNHFYIDAVSQANTQNSLLHTLSNSKKALTNFPFRNDGSVKRHGLRRRHFTVKSFLTNENIQFNVGVLKETPQVQFLVECNEVQRDFWGQAEDFYSGTFNVPGLNEVKLGKVLVTDETVQGAAKMVFYIEQYTDNFTVNQDGTGIWNQSIAVTRGIEIDDLVTRSGFKDKAAASPTGSFVPSKGRK